MGAATARLRRSAALPLREMDRMVEERVGGGQAREWRNKQTQSQ